MKKILLATFGMILLTLIVSQANADQTPEAPKKDIEFRITGAGSTFVFPLMDTWRVEYNKVYPNVFLNYQSIGSGGGVKQHTEKTVDFGASDAPLTPKERGIAVGSIHIPEAIGSIVVAYNLPEHPKSGLKLTGENVADIYLGKIKKWNDPRIQQNNPDVKLPDKNIVVTRRSDGSGTTYVFTEYLSKVSKEWESKVSKGKSVPWPVGVGAAGNEGVAWATRNTKYAIGYVELAYAFQNKMTYAYIQNADKTAFIEPNLETIFAAVNTFPIESFPEPQGDWSNVSITNAKGENSYPIASFTYILLYENLDHLKDREKAKALVHLIYWMITDGQKFTKPLLYDPISPAVQEIGKKGLARLKFNGEQLWKYEAVDSSAVSTAPPDSTPQIPSWIKNNAKWWSEGTIGDQDFVQGIQYLVKQEIIKIPPTTQGKSTSSQIPSWIKNNAKWWSEGAIGDQDFVKGIQYLITQGIISV